jgi:ketosteroid isomerase-like protein
MNVNEESNVAEIRELSKNFDDALERKDLDSIIAAFDEDCEIELLGVNLKGRKGAEKWINWLLSHVDRIQLVPIVILIKENIFFVEFVGRATLSGSLRVESKQTEVIEFEDGRIKKLRMYFNPPDFSDSVGGSIFRKWIVKLVLAATVEGLQ